MSYIVGVVFTGFLKTVVCQLLQVDTQRRAQAPRSRDEDGHDRAVVALQAVVEALVLQELDGMLSEETGFAIWNSYHDFIGLASGASKTAYAFKSHEARPGMKGIYRVLE